MTCPHGDIDPSCCPECLNGTPPEAPHAARLTVERTLQARFGGHCSGCNLPTYVGQQISQMSDGTYRHAACAS